MNELTKLADDIQSQQDAWLMKLVSFYARHNPGMTRSSIDALARSRSHTGARSVLMSALFSSFKVTSAEKAYWNEWEPGCVSFDAPVESGSENIESPAERSVRKYLGLGDSCLTEKCSLLYDSAVHGDAFLASLCCGQGRVLTILSLGGGKGKKTICALCSEFRCEGYREDDGAVLFDEEGRVHRPLEGTPMAVRCHPVHGPSWGEKCLTLHSTSPCADYPTWTTTIKSFTPTRVSIYRVPDVGEKAQDYPNGNNKENNHNRRIAHDHSKKEESMERHIKRLEEDICALRMAMHRMSIERSSPPPALESSNVLQRGEPLPERLSEVTETHLLVAPSGIDRISEVANTLSLEPSYWVQLIISSHYLGVPSPVTALQVTPGTCSADGLREAVKKKCAEDLLGVSIRRLQVWAPDAEMTDRWVPFPQESPLVPNTQDRPYHIVVAKEQYK